MEFIPNPAHKRSDLIRPTVQGQELLATTTEREAKFLARLPLHISEAELTSAATLLQRLREVVAGQQARDSEVKVKSRPLPPVPPALRKPNRMPKVTKRVAAAKEEAPPTDSQPMAPLPDEIELPVNLL